MSLFFYYVLKIATYVKIDYRTMLFEIKPFEWGKKIQKITVPQYIETKINVEGPIEIFGLPLSKFFENMTQNGYYTFVSNKNCSTLNIPNFFTCLIKPYPK